jgi:hypothetical protein
MSDPTGGQNLGRPPALDDAKRKTVIALLSNGSSRRVAAGYVGCAPSTITRTAARDPDFAAEVAHAEHHAEIEALRLVRNAARKERYWRAAAWLLERRNPNDFAPRKPNVLTDDQLRQALAWLATVVLKDLPEEDYESIMRRLDRLAPLLQPPDDEPNTPSTGPGFATDPTEVVDDFGEGPSPQLAEEQAHPEIVGDANETTL